MEQHHLPIRILSSLLSGRPMELMSLLNRYNVPLSKTERAFFKGIDRTGSSQTDAHYEQQIKRLADAREALKQMPDKKTSDRQSKAEKIKMLKERLKMLKQMIPFMSASAAKSLKAELKQIAAQIGALKDGSGGLATAAGTSIEAATATGSAGQAEAATAEAAAETAPDSSNTQQPETGSETDEAKDKDSSDKGNSALERANQSKAENAADRADQEELEKLKQLFQSVKQMLERKLQKPNDPGTQAALQLQAYQAAAEAIREATVSLKG